MATILEREATLADLAQVQEKAELINGRIVCLMPTGDMPSQAALELALTLKLHLRATGLPGIVVGDNAGFLASLPHRKSFSPDAAYYTGPRAGMGFFPEPPVFAAEVRSEGDYGSAMEEQMEAKRADYFAAGTQVVWDVDLLGEAIIRKFIAPDAHTPTALFARESVADAEPAVPGWTVTVNTLFE
nr:Uma2 family endonuclease [Armatimonas sp.]